ncbi:MAG: GspE/PulE family protein [Bacillota bacterium]|nr:GspE/PulE family protein [Bacillota bacterium]
MGVISEEELARSLAEQLGFRFSSTVNPEREVVKLVPEQVARRHRVLPLARRGKVLELAMANPLDLLAQEDVGLLTGLTVQPVVVPGRALEDALRRVYQMGLLEETLAPEEPQEIEIFRLRELVEQAPVVRLVTGIIEQALSARASDIHIEPHERGARVRFRVDGILREALDVPRGAQAPAISRVKLMAGMDISVRRLPQDGAFRAEYQGRSVDLRVATLPTAHGEKVSIRVLDRAQAITRLEDLGFLPDVQDAYREILRQARGMVLVTGPTGSGKTTTLHASLVWLNDPGLNLVTVEDPVEYHIPGVSQVQINEKAGLTFAVALRAILRQDPDIIMVGEIRDPETAEIAIRAALTGHLVLSTLHTGRAAQSVSRLLEMGLEPFLVASSLRAVLAQRLARRLCPHCAQTHVLPEDAPERAALALPPGPLELKRTSGCPRCEGLGFQGRVGIFELLRVDQGVRDLILARQPAVAIHEYAVGAGMRTLEQDAIEKALLGQISLEEARRVAFGGE